MEGLIYINPTYYRWDRKPNEAFKAIKFSGTLYPLANNYDNKEIFIYGYGHVKIGSRKLYEIPLYSEDPSEWDEYLNKYGGNCMFYSLIGVKLDSSGLDCCDLKIKQEFLIIDMYGIKKYLDYTSIWFRFNELQERYISQIPNISGWHRGQMVIYPSFSFFGCLSEPTLNVISDDKKLEYAYECKLYKELFPKHPLYSEYKNLVSIPKENRTMKNIDNLDDMSRQINIDIYAEIEKSMNNGTFPVCMRDRMIFLYGQEASDLYDQMINYNWD